MTNIEYVRDIKSKVDSLFDYIEHDVRENETICLDTITNTVLNEITSILETRKLEVKSVYPSYYNLKTKGEFFKSMHRELASRYKEDKEVTVGSINKYINLLYETLQNFAKLKRRNNEN